MRERKLLAFVCCAAIGWVLPAAVLAQEGPAPMGYVVITSVKPGTQPQYEAAVTKLAQAHKKANSPIKWGASIVSLGATGPTYIYVVPLQKYADMDAWQAFRSPQLLAKAYGEAEGQKILQSMGAAMASNQTSIMTGRPDLSNPPAAPPEGGAAQLGYVYVAYLKPGGAPQYEAALSKMAEAYKKAASPVKWRTSMTSVGGTGPTYAAVLPLRKYGDMDAWESTPPQVLTQVYGEAEAQKILQSMAGAVASTQTWLVESRPDLAHQ